MKRLRLQLLLLISLCIGALTPAAAAEPQSAPVPAASDQPSTEAEAKADAQAKAEAKAKAAADAKAKAVDTRLRALGYKPINHNGTVRYCRSEQALGSRFERSVCGTPEELDFAAQSGKETVQWIQQRSSPTPVNPSGH